MFCSSVSSNSETPTLAGMSGTGSRGKLGLLAGSRRMSNVALQLKIPSATHIARRTQSWHKKWSWVKFNSGAMRIMFISFRSDPSFPTLGSNSTQILTDGEGEGRGRGAPPTLPRVWHPTGHCHQIDPVRLTQIHRRGSTKGIFGEKRAKRDLG